MDRDKMTARTYFHLGAVAWLGYENPHLAIEYFGMAKRIRPSIQPTPTLETPELRALFDRAELEKAPTPLSLPAPKARPATPPTEAVEPQLRGKRLVVLEFEGANVPEDLLRIFSNNVRAATLPWFESRGGWMIPRDETPIPWRDVGGKECAEEDCEVRVARSLGADFMISGRLVVSEDVHEVTLKLHEARGGSLLGSISFYAKGQVDTLHALRDHARSLMGKLLRAHPAAR
jgi:hypothetical protein